MQYTITYYWTGKQVAVLKVYAKDKTEAINVAAVLYETLYPDVRYDDYELA